MKGLIFLTLFSSMAIAAGNQSWKDKAQMLGCPSNYFGGNGSNEKKAAFDSYAKSQHAFNGQCTAPSEEDLKTPIIYKAAGSATCKIMKLENTPYGRWVKR